MTAKEITYIVSERYQLPEWAFITELDLFTGIRDNVRSIDCYAIHCWGNKDMDKGFSIAFEVKISRQDFHNELKMPKKREDFVKYSNQFYFVCPEGVLEKEEIPEECGLITVKGGDLKYRKFAPQREIDVYPKELVASITRRSDDRNPQNWILFKLMGKDISYNDLIKYIEEEKEKYKVKFKQEFFREMEKRTNVIEPKLQEKLLRRVKEMEEILCGE